MTYNYMNKFTTVIFN